MLGSISKLGRKAQAVAATMSAVAVAVVTTALTYSGGVVTFDNADKTAIDGGISNALANLWAGFTFVLPYVGVALGVVIVIGTVYYLAKRAGGAAH